MWLLVVEVDLSHKVTYLSCIKHDFDGNVEVDLIQIEKLFELRCLSLHKKTGDHVQQFTLELDWKQEYQTSESTE